MCHVTNSIQDVTPGCCLAADGLNKATEEVLKSQGQNLNAVFCCCFLILTRVIRVICQVSILCRRSEIKNASKIAFRLTGFSNQAPSD